MSDEQTPGGGAPKPPNAGSAFSPEQMAELAIEAGRVANGQWSARSKALRKEISEDFTKALGDLTKGFEEKIVALTAGAGGKKKDGEGGKDPARTPQDAALERQVKELADKLAASEAKSAAAEQRIRESGRRTATMNELAKLGMDGNRGRGAFAWLEDEKRIHLDEDDPNTVLYKDDNGDMLPLVDGLRGWSKREEAKIFLPPTGAKGSGDPNRGKAPPAGGTPGQEPSDADIGAGIAAAFGGGQVPI